MGIKKKNEILCGLLTPDYYHILLLLLVNHAICVTVEELNHSFICGVANSFNNFTQTLNACHKTLNCVIYAANERIHNVIVMIRIRCRLCSVAFCVRALSLYSSYNINARRKNKKKQFVNVNSDRIKVVHWFTGNHDIVFNSRMPSPTYPAPNCQQMCREVLSILPSFFVVYFLIFSQRWECFSFILFCYYILNMERSIWIVITDNVIQRNVKIKIE